MTTSPTTNPLGAVIDAMRSIQTEADRWTLAEALQAQIPSGAQGFETILDVAAAEGVAGNLKPNTLRLYRDTAVRWPADKRVKNVSFSAHREAMASTGGINAAAKLLAGLSATLGPDKVTVASVRKAVAVNNGNVTGPATAASAARPMQDILQDFRNGGGLIIKAIDPTTEGLDDIHAGLQNVIAHVESLRAKIARANKGKSTPTTKAAPITPTGTATAPATAGTKQGDLRNL